MYRKLIIIPVMMMLVMGCSEQEVLPTTPTKSFEGSGSYVPQSYTPTPEKGAVTSTVNYSTTNIQELEKRISKLEQHNTILEGCLASIVGAIMSGNSTSLEWSWRTAGDCKDYRDIYYVR